MNHCKTLLSIDDLSVHYKTEKGTLVAVDRLSLDIYPGKTFALVGQTGCGKTTLALAIMRLLYPFVPSATEGRIFFEGQNLFEFSEKKLNRIRGNSIAMIFQESALNLNPIRKIGSQIVESLIVHHNLSKNDTYRRAVEMLELLGMPDPARRMNEYPHQLSGGMRRLVNIAAALIARPKLLIADEPTTALDVTVQHKVLELFRNIQIQTGMAVLLITHDLALVRRFCDDVAVMYASRIVQFSPVVGLFTEPVHPYIKSLLHLLPRIDKPSGCFDVIDDSVPDGAVPFAGCDFCFCCPVGKDLAKCRTQKPPLERVTPSKCLACWYPEKHRELLE